MIRISTKFRQTYYILPLFWIFLIAVFTEDSKANDLNPKFYFYQYDWNGDRFRAEGKIESDNFSLFSKMNAVNEQNQIIDFGKCRDGKIFVLLKVPSPRMREPFSKILKFSSRTAYELSVYQNDQSHILFARSFLRDDYDPKDPKFLFSKDCRYIAQLDRNQPQWIFDFKNQKETSIKIPYFSKRNSYLHTTGVYYWTGDQQNILYNLDFKSGQVRELLKTNRRIEHFDFKEWQENQSLLGVEMFGSYDYGIIQFSKDGEKVLKEINLKTFFKNNEYLVDIDFLDNENLILTKVSRPSSAISTLIVKRTSLEILAEFKGHGLKMLNNGYYKIMRLEGSNEVNPYLLNSSFQTIYSLGFKDKFGQYVCDATYGELLCKFSSNFIQGRIFGWQDDFKIREVFATNSIGNDVNGEKFIVTSTDDFKAPTYLFSMASPTQSKGIILMVHGGGCHMNHYYDVNDFDSEHMELIMAGYTLVGITYRNDRTFLPENPPKKSPKEMCGTKEIDDILAVRATVAQRYPGLPIFLRGHSQGGYLANLMATKYAGRAKWNGIISSAGMWKYTSKYPPRNMDEHYNSENAPIDYLNQLKVPFLLWHGKIDSTVDFQHAEEFLKKIIYTKDTDNLKVFTPDLEEHHFKNFRNHQIWMEMVLDFLSRNS